jgi:hypothetical protein
MGLQLAVKDISVIDKLFYWFGRVQFISKEIPVSTCTNPVVMHYRLPSYVIDGAVKEGGIYALLKIKGYYTEFRRMSEGSCGLRRLLYNPQLLRA